jgi:translation initiation factor IF-2
MKTLTEFSGTMIRMAARAESEARKNIPKELLAVVPAQEPSEGVTAKPDETASAPAVQEAGDSASDAADQALAQEAAGGSGVVGSGEREAKAGEAGTADDESQPGAAEEEEREEAVAGQDLAGAASGEERATEGGAEPSDLAAEEKTAKGEQAAETSAVKEILDKAVSEATGAQGDRLERLREAVRASKRQTDRVRLVRVFGSEEPVNGATRIGEFQYVVDLMPHSMKQNFERDEKAGRRGPRRPSGGGKQKEGSLEGSFSMESVAQDRRNERSTGGGGRGKPGGRGGPGGGRGRPGGGRGGKPGGASKR